jgi:uncharacterized membrane protein
MSSLDSMNRAISSVLRVGVILSAAVIVLGTLLLLSKEQGSDVSGLLTYFPSQIPHGAFPVDFQSLADGLLSLDPYAVIQLGVIVLVATPVSRVVTSIIIYSTQKDWTYVSVTSGVLCLLLFSIIVTPFIPGFNV